MVLHQGGSEPVPIPQPSVPCWTIQECSVSSPPEPPPRAMRSPSCLRHPTSESPSKRRVSFGDVSIGETYEKYNNYFSVYDRTPLKTSITKGMSDAHKLEIELEVEKLRYELFPDGQIYGDQEMQHEGSVMRVLHTVSCAKKMSLLAAQYRAGIPSNSIRLQKVTNDPDAVEYPDVPSSPSSCTAEQLHNVDAIICWSNNSPRWEDLGKSLEGKPLLGKSFDILPGRTPS